ncbi:MAG: YicC family protein [Clostridia bacterium]|nr:YicC family protein [Clostridia bacterium]
MLKSMTGFGKGVAVFGGGTVSVEIKSVNSKTLDLQIKMPRELSAFEVTVKKALREKVSRGKVDVFVQFDRDQSSEYNVMLNGGLAKAYLEKLRNGAEEFGLEKALSPEILLKIPDAITVERPELDEDELEKCVFEASKAAVSKLSEMRETEGAYLDGEIRRLVGEISGAFETIKARAPFVSVEYKQKLTERLEKLLDSPETLDEQRIAQEVAFFADRADITEETARIGSHLAQIMKYLDSGEPCGREIDFVLQEFKREINTLGSKSNDSELFESVLTVKSKLEMLREQIQNIE